MDKQFKEIPSVFHSSAMGAPIEHCLVCDRYLLDDADYVIEKSITRYPRLDTKDTIYEIAVCSECLQSLMSEYSEESERKLNDYFMQNMDFSHQFKLLEHEMFDVDDWISRCIIKKTSITENSHYQICAHAKGSKIIYDRSPFMISGAAIDEMTDLLSNETIDFFNDFRDQYLTPPEDLSPLFKDKDFVLI